MHAPAYSPVFNPPPLAPPPPFICLYAAPQFPYYTFVDRAKMYRCVGRPRRTPSLRAAGEKRKTAAVRP